MSDKRIIQMPTKAEPIELPSCDRLEIIISKHNRVWVNVDGRCIFRTIKAMKVLVFDKRDGDV